MRTPFSLFPSRSGNTGPVRGFAGSRTFTDFVRSFEREPPRSERVAEVLKALRLALRGELRRRGLWESPPCFLGVYGFESWSGEAGACEDPLGELVSECYCYVFVDRLRSLRAHLALKPNVEGLVLLSLRHFLHERQKEHDPLGFRVFEALQSAVRTAAEAGELWVVAGDPRVRNDTVLAFAPGAEAPACPVDLRGLVARWNGALLPDLLTARGKHQDQLVERLRGLLPELRDEGVEAIRFKDLVDPWKADVRARWAAIFEHAEGEVAFEGAEEDLAGPVRYVTPDTRFEERESFERLTDCVHEALGKLQANEATRGYLVTLWEFLRLQAGEEEERPSLRKLAEMLRIPRDRLPGLYQTLGRIVEECRAANSWNLAVTPLARRSRLEGPRGAAP